MSTFVNKGYQDLTNVAKQYQVTYTQAAPFSNIYFNDFFDPDMLEQVLAEFPDLSTQHAIKYDNPKEKKLNGKGESPFGPATKSFMHFLNSQPFLEFIQELTGIKEILIGDPYFIGAGLHEIKKGGLLKIHADFNRHPTTNLDRRVNVLVYLNKDWKEEYGGHFELWDTNMERCEKKILPLFNTLAIFSTTDFSYHGHPNPLNCPDDRSRKSLALYYYSNGRPQEEVNSGLEDHSTLFKERKGNVEDMQAFVEPKRSSARELVKDLIPPIFVKAYRKLSK